MEEAPAAVMEEKPRMSPETPVVGWPPIRSVISSSYLLLGLLEPPGYEQTSCFGLGDRTKRTGSFALDFGSVNTTFGSMNFSPPMPFARPQLIDTFARSTSLLRRSIVRLRGLSGALRNKDSDEVQFSMINTSNGCFEIKIGSQTMRPPNHSSALVYMMLFARNLFDDTFACPKSMVPIRILNWLRGLRSMLYEAPEADWVPNPRPESCNGGTAGGTPVGSTGRNSTPRVRVHSSVSQNPTHTKTRNQSGPVKRSVMEKTAATWLVATAAAHHATGNRDLLSGFMSVQPGRFLRSADGAVPMQVVGNGSVITDTVVLPNVLYVPGLTANLVSASQLAELDYTVGFSRGACHIRSAADGSIVGKASVGEDGLLELDFLKIMPAI